MSSTQVASSSEVEDILKVAEIFSEKWGSAHGTSTHKVYTVIGSKKIAFIIKEAFSQAELDLATYSEGKALLHIYIEQLMEQSCIETAIYLERVTDYYIRFINFLSDFKNEQIICIFDHSKE